jgi:hypothetical protein
MTEYGKGFQKLRPLPILEIYIPMYGVDLIVKIKGLPCADSAVDALGIKKQ